MASSKKSTMFGLQDWKKFYEPYSSADLQSYDFESLRKNFIDYLKRNYPETFNDYVESSEFVALLDIIAYMGQAMAFRSDLNARENFIDTAQRRDSVIKLANLVGYTPKRNTSGQGLVKITAVQTSESVLDINGNNLSNQPILWNDPGNRAWQEQFNAVVNAALINNQRVGKPGNSNNILDIKTDEYTINLQSNQLPVMKFQTSVNGQNMNFELVSATSLNQEYIYELPPAPSSQFNILYRNDKLGFGSQNTGFFAFFKQGSLLSQDFSLPQQIENNQQPINIQGINDEDTWLYKLDTTNTPTDLWTQVQNVYVANNNKQSNAIKTIYSVISRANDEITLSFSDGIFGEIPVGNYRAYVRTSNAKQYTINPADMSALTATIPYVSRQGKAETLTITFSLQTPCSTALNRESLAQIKERAPSRYYSQNRMVNGEDYTNFAFTLYNSIIKSKAVNRTSIGVSRNLDLLDPTGKYSSTNVFANDGAITFDNTPTYTSFSTASSSYATEFLSSTLTSLLGSAPVIQYYQTYYTKKGSGASGSGSWRWNLTSISGSQVTGYFYVDVAGTTSPFPLGPYSTTNAKYITKGAMVKFEPVDADMYFDENNRLTKTNTGIKYVWIGVDNVVGDGFNYGAGNLSTGTGPVTLNKYLPGNPAGDQVQITAVESIIPQFDNSLSSTIISEALAKIKVQQNFALQFDDTVLSNKERWSVIDIPVTDPSTKEYYTDHLVKFEHSAADGAYNVTIRTVNYKFSSAKSVRFLFDGVQRVYDPKTGEMLQDTITILPTDLTVNPITHSYTLNVIGQPTQVDGFADDFQVTVSPIDPNTGYSSNPDFFERGIVVLTAGNYPTVKPQQEVFFSAITDLDGLNTIELLPTTTTVIYNNTYSSLSAINDIIYEQPVGTIFYCEKALNVSLSAAPISRSSTSYKVTAVSDIEHKLSSGWTVTIADAGKISESNRYPYNGSHVITVEDEFTFTYEISSTVSLLAISGARVANRFYQSVELAGSVPAVYLFQDVTDSYKVECGRNGLNFQYRHNSGQSNRIDPATSNIIDLFLVTQDYYTNYSNWLADNTGKISKPSKPTLNDLQQAYGELSSYKMISDNIVLNSVEFKPLFGTKADPALQATIKVVKSTSTTASDSQIRSAVLSAMNTYFAIDNWSFGDTFFMSEMTAYLHVQLSGLVSSIIVVPNDPTKGMSKMLEVHSLPNEIFVNGATASDISVISNLNNVA
jgi:hypothetical protein